VLRVAARLQVQALGRLVSNACDHLLGENQGTGPTLRSDARAVDAAYHALVTTGGTVRRSLSGVVNEDIGRALSLASDARHYSRNLVVDTRSAGSLDIGTRLDIELAAATLRQSLDTVADATAGRRDGVYTRSSALFNEAERRIEERSGTAARTHLAIRDLKLIDVTMAQMAEVLGLAVTDHDGNYPSAASAMHITGGESPSGKPAQADG
jgi:hypothetical protein